jgi:hypothetical protein
MNQKTTILPILAILSVAALIGGFAIQAADAAWYLKEESELDHWM